jgi:hypothetical protein
MTSENAFLVTENQAKPKIATSAEINVTVPQARQSMNSFQINTRLKPSTIDDNGFKTIKNLKAFGTLSAE